VRVTSRSLPLALVLAASALIVSGCSPEAAVPSAPPAAEAEPLFASDEEALEAAGDVAAVLDRPDPILAQAARPAQGLAVAGRRSSHRLAALQLAGARLDGGKGVG